MPARLRRKPGPRLKWPSVAPTSPRLQSDLLHFLALRAAVLEGLFLLGKLLMVVYRYSLFFDILGRSPVLFSAWLRSSR